jgi:hypothetical protein
MSSFFLRQKLQSQNVTREKLFKTLSYTKKGVHKMLMKLTNLISIEAAD